MKRKKQSRCCCYLRLLPYQSLDSHLLKLLTYELHFPPATDAELKVRALEYRVSDRVICDCFTSEVQLVLSVRTIKVRV